MVSQFADFPLRETLFFVEKSNSFGFLKRIHLQPNEILGECWQLVDAICVNDPRWDRDVVEELAGGESPPPSDETIAAAFSWCHHDCLQQAVGENGFCQRLYRLVGHGLTERGTVHVYLVKPYVLFHKSPGGGALTITKFVRLGKPMFSPQSPLSSYPNQIKT